MNTCSLVISKQHYFTQSFKEFRLSLLRTLLHTCACTMSRVANYYRPRWSPSPSSILTRASTRTPNASRSQGRPAPSTRSTSTALSSSRTMRPRPRLRRFARRRFSWPPRWRRQRRRARRRRRRSLRRRRRSRRRRRRSRRRRRRTRWHQSRRPNRQQRSTPSPPAAL